MKEFNPKLRLSKSLENHAQNAAKCVRRHSDHKSTDRKVLNEFGGYKAIIACSGGGTGCDIGPNGPSNFDKNRPADIWKSFRHQTKHYNHIKSSKVMGCSVAIGRYFGGNERCVYCYLV